MGNEHTGGEGSTREQEQWDTVIHLLSVLRYLLDNIMSALDDLKAEVAATVTVEASAVALIQGIAAQLQNLLAQSANPDPEIQALTDQLTASATALSAAVAANTPAPAPSPAPAPAADTPPADTATS
jgi:uncharacterized membrane protein affecting hemolysin expression